MITRFRRHRSATHSLCRGVHGSSCSMTDACHAQCDARNKSSQGRLRMCLSCLDPPKCTAPSAYVTSSMVSNHQGENSSASVNIAGPARSSSSSASNHNWQNGVCAPDRMASTISEWQAGSSWRVRLLRMSCAQAPAEVCSLLASIIIHQTSTCTPASARRCSSAPLSP